MRWLFLLLLILNVAYLAWELNRDQPQHTARKALPKNVESIVLLSELDASGPEAAATAQSAATESEHLPPAVPSSPVSVQPPEPRASLAVQQPQTTDAVVSPEIEAPVVEAEAGSRGDAGTEPVGDLCYTLGPFKEMKKLRLVTREIRDFVVEASFRSKEEQEQTMFRVLVRPAASKQEAKAMVRELVSKNIKDYFIITEGPQKNGISLGYFSEKSRAYRHTRRVRKLGFDAITEPVFKSYTIYWLDYRINSGNEIPRQILDQHLEKSTQRLSRACG